VGVVLPSGRGVPAVDVMVGFDGGEPEQGYTQTDGWQLAKGEKRRPRWVQVSMSTYGLISPRFPVDVRKANALTFMLTPNDIGPAGLRTAVTVKGNVLTLGRDGRTMTFERGSGKLDAKGS
jgi:hypothetical protein